MNRTIDEYPERRFKKASPIFAQGDLSTGVWLVMSGSVALAMSSGTGRQLVISHEKPGAILGLPGVLGEGRYLWSAVAETNATLRFIPKANVLAMFRDDPITGLELVQGLSEDLRALYARMAQIHWHHVGDPQKRSQ